MAEPMIVAGTFADLERAVREICRQIDLLVQHIPEEEDRAYAELAMEYLWRMYRSAYEHALAREGLGP
jgi:hypothetical protein